MSDYETTQRRRNMIVGVFVVVGVCALIWLIFKFGDLPTAVTKMGSFEVFVQFPTAPGVQNDTPVRFCGYQIGRVTKVMPPQIKKDMVTGLEYYQTIVVLSIDKKYPTIPSNIEVKLMSRGLGSSYVEIKQYPDRPAEPLDPNRPETVYLVDKILLQGSTGITSEFFPEESQKKLDDLVEGLRVLIANANDILGNRSNKENLQKTIANLTEASHEAKQTIEEFRKFAVAGTTTLKNVDSKTEELVVAMVGTSEEIGKASAQMRMILEKINNGQGSAAMLLNDGQFYESLLEDTQQVQLLLEELKSFITQARNNGVPIKLK
ncbi:MAG: MCE family protein [Planctomycetes bacterium]|nr:MCE family protein [Planctomycetota bacterium]MBL7144677.1 MCE family protein [Phycisphaerae bacterium]